MNKKNVVLLGGSNSVMVNGLQKGIKEGIEEFNTTIDKQEDFLEFYNFAIGGCTAIQNLYEVVRHKEILDNSQLIITESNVNELHNHVSIEKLSLVSIYKQLAWFYKELFYLNKKVLILILAEYSINNDKIHTIINNLHKKFAKQYGFNIIDIHDYYEKNFLQDFGKAYDGGGHQFGFIMRKLGKAIVKNIYNYKFSKEKNFKNDNPKFLICTPKDMKLINGDLQEFRINNSMYEEKIYRINSSTKLKFPSIFDKYQILGFHSWNNNTERKELFKVPCNWYEAVGTYSSIALQNNTRIITREMAFLMQFISINNVDFKVDSNTFVVSNKDNIPFTEHHINVETWRKDVQRLECSDIISFFLASPEGNYHTEEIDFEALANENIEIPKEYNFNHLIPPVELYKEIIDEYCSIMDPRKLFPLQNQISILTQEKQDLQNKFQNELNSLPVKKQRLELANLEQDLIIKKLESKKLAKSLGIKMSIINPRITFIQANSAKARIQNHLSYKLGQALIENSKSILGYIRMPYVLSYIKDKHKQEQKAYEEKIKENPKLALPPLETYPDYNEALKEKECFTYKLGEEFIKASRNWYGGGYIKFYFKDVPRLKREFGKKG
ncbi:hypothetical protein OLP39_05775 [Campylobacter jejuni]|nr:hypothetical protein [Campylobacter jejuni]MCW1347728.1 hypothetical protein [Campylobacter jejuni]